MFLDFNDESEVLYCFYSNKAEAGKTCITLARLKCQSHFARIGHCFGRMCKELIKPHERKTMLCEPLFKRLTEHA